MSGPGRWVALLALALAGCSTGETAATSDARAGVEATWAGFIDAWEAGDLAAVASLYTEDAINMIDYSSVQRGREEIRQQFGPGFDGGRFDVLEQTTEEVIAAGDLAYERGTLEQTYTPTGGAAIRQNMSYTALFRRGDDGVWRIHRWAAQLAE